MVNFEKKSVEIQNHMHDSVRQNFDRVLASNDNGLTLYRENKMNSQKVSIYQEMPLMMMY